MKKNVLKNIEEIKEKMTISPEIKKKIKERFIANWAICISILILILIFKTAANSLQKLIAIKIYNISSIMLLFFTLILLEIAYKKDNETLAICGIEMLVLSIFTLFSPYVFFIFSPMFIYITIAFLVIYYIIKMIRIYFDERKKYISVLSDITEIVKKETQDKLAQEFKYKVQEQHKKRNTTKKKEPAKRKQTSKTTKKKESTNKKATTKTTQKKESTNKKATTKTTQKKESTDKKEITKNTTKKEPTKKKQTTTKTKDKKITKTNKESK